MAYKEPSNKAKLAKLRQDIIGDGIKESKLEKYVSLHADSAGNKSEIFSGYSNINLENSTAYKKEFEALFKESNLVCENFEYNNFEFNSNDDYDVNISLRINGKDCIIANTGPYLYNVSIDENSNMSNIMYRVMRMAIPLCVPIYGSDTAPDPDEYSNCYVDIIYSKFGALPLIIKVPTTEEGGAGGQYIYDSEKSVKYKVNDGDSYFVSDMASTGLTLYKKDGSILEGESY